MYGDENVRNSAASFAAMKATAMFSPSAKGFIQNQHLSGRRNSGTKRIRFVGVMPLPEDCVLEISAASTAEILEQALHEVEKTVNRKGRGVRFNLHRNKSHAAESAPLTDEEIEHAWWNSKDCEGTTLQYRQEVHRCLQSESQAVQEILKIVSQCNQSSRDQLDNHDEVVQAISQSSLPRGMESDIVSVMKTLRRKHSEAVLQYVHKIPKHFKPDLRERMLSARSLQYSRSYSILSHLFGEADALACNN